MCNAAATTIVQAVSTAAQVGVSVYQANQAVKAEKRAEAERRKALNSLQITPKLADATSRTASSLNEINTTTKKTIGTLKIPIEKTTNTANTGINSSSITTGLNIPL